MKGDKKELTRRQELAITALLQHGGVSRAALASNIPESTLWRWMQQKDFAIAYRAARRTIMERTTALLQQASTMAAAKLINMITDDSVPPYVQLAAARSVIEFGRQGQEIEDIQERITALEEALEIEQPKGKLLAL
jgi:hypothetical protein